MTTFINVVAHAGWPVEVTPYEYHLDAEGVEVAGEYKTPTIVPAGNTEGFYVWDGRSLYIRELPQRPTAAVSPTLADASVSAPASDAAT